METPSIGIISGTGPAGSGVAARLAAAGYTVVLGSRDVTKAQTAVVGLSERWGTRRLSGLRAGTNGRAAQCDIVIMGCSAETTLLAAETHGEALAGKVVVSMAAGMARGDRGMRATRDDKGSIACALQDALPESRIAASLHHIAAGTLLDPQATVDADLLVCADDDAAIDAIAPLLAAISEGQLIDAGTLDNAVALEAMTAVLVTHNAKTKAHSSLRLIDTRERAHAAA